MQASRHGGIVTRSHSAHERESLMSSNLPLGPMLALGAICGVLAACSDGGDPATAPEIRSPTPSVSASAAAPAFVQVSGGGGHTCGITAASRAYCWGNNYQG